MNKSIAIHNLHVFACIVLLMEDYTMEGLLIFMSQIKLFE